MAITKATYAMIEGAPVNVLDYGADPTGVADSTAAIQAAVNASKTIYLPNGTYTISAPIRLALPNPLNLTIFGESQENTIIKSAASMTNKNMLWFGNSTGYGAQYITVRNLTVDGRAAANGNTGILYQSCGLSLVQDVTIINCGRAAWMLGCIDTAMLNCNIFTSTEGAWWDVYPLGVPANNDDLTAQAIQTTRANISRMVGCWTSAITQTAVYISGGQFLLDACTFQSATNNQAYNVVEVEDSNESYDYGGGPIIQNCWFEGGDFKYYLSIKNTRQTRINNNFFTGGFASGPTKEGAILLDDFSVRNVSIKNNAIRGYFQATPTDGRLANAAIYVTDSIYTYTSDIENNYVTTNTTNVYWAGLTSPTVDRYLLGLYAYTSVSAGVPTVNFQSTNFILSVTKNGTGDFTVQYNFNRRPIASGKYPILVTCSFSSAGQGAYAVQLTSGANTDRLQFYNAAGAIADPDGFTLMLVGGGWAQA
jgi:hypothetical protein